MKKYLLAVIFLLSISVFAYDYEPLNLSTADNSILSYNILSSPLALSGTKVGATNATVKSTNATASVTKKSNSVATNMNASRATNAIVTNATTKTVKSTNTTPASVSTATNTTKITAATNSVKKSDSFDIFATFGNGNDVWKPIAFYSGVGALAIGGVCNLLGALDVDAVHNAKLAYSRTTNDYDSLFTTWNNTAFVMNTKYIVGYSLYGLGAVLIVTWLLLPNDFTKGVTLTPYINADNVSFALEYKF